MQCRYATTIWNQDPQYIYAITICDNDIYAVKMCNNDMQYKYAKTTWNIQVYNSYMQQQYAIATCNTDTR